MRGLILYRRLLIVVVGVVGLIGLAGVVRGQWELPAQLTDDNYDYLRPSLAVDDSLHLHIFYARRVFQLPNVNWAWSLYYQRFDNWGNPLSEALDLLPDTIFANVYQPGVLLDSDGRTIHVAWSRSMNEEPFLHQTFYIRLNVLGEIEIGPIELPVDDPQFAVHAVMNLVEDTQGNIWISAYSRFAEVDSNGTVVEPLTRIIGPWPNAGERAFAGRDPAGHIWLCFRHFQDQLQQISIMRIDTTERIPEVISLDTGDLQMGPQAFHIDSAGVFHYILYRDDAGLFYQRDPRDGSPVDTLVFDGSPYGTGETYFTLIDGDTLQYMYGQSLPHQPGLVRVQFTLNGEMALPPTLITPIPFYLDQFTPLIWKQGGYWTVGTRGEYEPTRSQLQLLHVPGPNEPPNTLSPHVDQTLPSSYEISVYPQPVRDSFTLNLPAISAAPLHVKMYNVLGQLILERNFDRVQGLSLPFTLPVGISSGAYFFNVRSASHTSTLRLILNP